MGSKVGGSSERLETEAERASSKESDEEDMARLDGHEVPRAERLGG